MSNKAMDNGKLKMDNSQAKKGDVLSMPKGYKNTEIGVIPEDWDCSILGENAIKIGSGITPTGGSSVYKEIGRPFVRSQNIGWGKLILDDIAFIDDEIHQTFPNTEIKLNDVFLNISGASIGRSSFAGEKLVGGNVNQHVCIIRTIDKQLNPRFLNLFLLSVKGQKQIDSFQSGGNRQGLNIGQIRTFLIPLPPLPEQTAIATVLSDTDNLIQALEKKIAKKQLIKKGAMQLLFVPPAQTTIDNGKLTIDNGGWEVKTLGEVFNFKQGVQCGVEKQVTEIKKGFKRFIRIIDLSQEGEPPRFILDPGSSHHIKKDDLFMVRYGNPGLLGFGYEGVIANNLFSLKPLLATHQLFFYFLLSFKKDKIIELSSSTTMAAINFTSLKALEIVFPKSKEEQIHIAQILSDMDIEIETLKKKLAKYKQLKQGLMQNLLTGKIRIMDN